MKTFLKEFRKFYVLIILLTILLIKCSIDQKIDQITLNEIEDFKLIATDEDVLNLINFLSDNEVQIINSFTTGSEITISSSSSLSDKFSHYKVINKLEFNRYFELMRYKIGINESYKEDLASMFHSSNLTHSEKEYLYNLIWIEDNFINSKQFKEFLFKLTSGPKSGFRTDPCNCNSIYSSYLAALSQCYAYGGSYCQTASNLQSQYFACLNLTPTCPNGFTFDGANCYSAIHYPSGYQGFIYGNGFYTQRNCNISTANNCCPSGFTFDGANCHWYGVYFPPNYQAFIYNNCFYLFPQCQ